MPRPGPGGVAYHRFVWAAGISDDMAGAATALFTRIRAANLSEGTIWDTAQKC